VRFSSQMKVTLLRSGTHAAGNGAMPSTAAPLLLAAPT
jgi:hypothetical protein